MIKFKELKIGDKFECYGDTFINYDYPKICKCVKIDNDKAQELNDSFSDGLGITFFINPGDEVFIYEEPICSKTITEAESKGYTVSHAYSLLNNETQNIMNNYDSKPDTLLHIKRVNQLLTEAACELIRRANVHDDSKLLSPEKELFDEFTPKLKASVYGSDEYKEMLKGLKVALDHHYANNSHHPEHYPNGINGFDLFDLIEMFFDWKAATERHDNGDIRDSIRVNEIRFNMSQQLVDIFTNTAVRLGYIPGGSDNENKSL